MNIRSTVIYKLAILSIGLLLAGCNSVTIHINDDGYQEAHTIGYINAVDLWGSGELVIENGHQDQLIIIATKEVHENLDVFVRDNTLHVGPKKDINFNLVGSHKIKYILVRDGIEDVDLSGASTLILPDYSVSQLTIDSSGASEFDLQLDTSVLTIKGSGAVNGFIAGVADEFNARLSGASDVNAINLKVKWAKVGLSGASSLDLNVSETLDASASGSSDIDARESQVKSAIVKLSGASSIYLNVADSIEGSASGASDVRYLGRPSVSVSTSGASDVHAK